MSVTASRYRAEVPTPDSSAAALPPLATWFGLTKAVVVAPAVSAIRVRHLHGPSPPAA